MDAAFGELAAQPKLALLHRYEARLHLMYQRALRNLLLLRQMGDRRELSAPGTTTDRSSDSPEASAPGTADDLVVGPRSAEHPAFKPISDSLELSAPGTADDLVVGPTQRRHPSACQTPSQPQTPELPNKPITPNPCNKFPTRTPAKPPQNTPKPAPTSPQHVKLLTGT